MNAFYQLLTVGIQCIERIDRVVFGFVCSRIVQYKQRIESFDTGLSGITLHLLRLIHNDNRIVGRNHINRSAASKLVALGVYDAALLTAATLFHGGCKGLRIDNHHAQSRV